MSRRRAPDLVPLEGFLPPDGATYPQVLRGPNYQPWQPFLGLAAGMILFLVLTAAINRLVIAIGWWFVGRTETLDGYAAKALAFERPIGMLAANLAVASLVPVCWLLMTVVHRVRPRWLSSITPGIRWRYLAISLLVAALALNAVLALSTLFAPPLTWSVQPGFLGFLVVIVLTSPLQAVAEEVFFRGYLMQALGSLVANPWFGVVASSVLFALLHGTQNLPLFLDRLGFGLLAAVLVLRTGGLEAGIAAHVINNVCAYAFAGLTGSIASLKALQQIGWTDAAFDVLGFALFAGLAYLVAVRLKLRRTVDLSLPH